MNPSPMGGFMEGIAGGVRGATAIKLQGDRLKAEKESFAAQMQMKMGFRLYDALKGNPEAQSNVLKKFIQPGYGHFNKQTDRGFSDEEWNQFFNTLNMENKQSKALLDSLMDVGKQVEAGKLSDEAGLDAYDLLVGTYKGQLSGREEDYIKQDRAKRVAEGRKKEIGALLKPGMGKEGKPGEPSPLMAGLTKAYGPEAAGGISAATQAGTPLHQAAGMFPKKKAPAAPTTPMYKKEQLAGGGVQEMQYNPKTGKHDIPFGKPKEAGEGHCFRLGHSYYQIKRGKPELIQKGSIDEKATMNAMKEFGWSMMPEADQAELVAKHKRLLQGAGKKPGQGMKLTREIAITLLESAGGDKAKARKLAKEQGYSF